MNESAPFEYVVAEKPEGKRKLIVALVRIGVITVFAGLVFLFLGFQLYPLAILPLSFLGVFMYFWKLSNREFEYAFVSGVMTCSCIYGGMKRKKMLEVVIKDMREIAPVEENTIDHLRQIGVEKDYRLVSTSYADDMYYAVFDYDGKLCVLYFEATKRALEILYYYNHSTKVTKVAR